ncbi:aminotransferase A [Jeotgalibacillus sp. R-1-5s-1]|nr:aminotransferase A [Jeotgalibacillus sp. R-1-5s-1]
MCPAIKIRYNSKISKRSSKGVKVMNETVSQLQISGIRQFFNRIQHIENMISLTIGQPDFHTPDHIKQAAAKAILDNQTTYTHNAGILELRKAVSTFMKKKYDLDYQAEDEMIITNGASQAIDTALRTILSPDQDVILPGPVYPGYVPVIKQCGARPVFADTTKTGFKMTADLIRETLTDQTTCIVLPYPSNPTGVSLTEDEITEIANLAKEKDLYIIADEIYSELVYDRPHFSIGRLYKEKTIVINGLSKSHAMTGWRIGVLMAPSGIAEQCLKVHQYTVSCVSSISQHAAVAAYTHGMDDAIPMRNEYKLRRDFTAAHLAKLGFTTVHPDGAFYFLAGIPDDLSLSSFDFAVELAEQAGVGVVPGTAFAPYGEGYVRISYACSMDQLKEAFTRIEQFLNKKRR